MNADGHVKVGLEEVGIVCWIIHMMIVLLCHGRRRVNHVPRRSGITSARWRVERYIVGMSDELRKNGGPQG